MDFILWMVSQESQSESQGHSVDICLDHHIVDSIEDLTLHMISSRLLCIVRD